MPEDVKADKITVINPNSSTAVTRAMDAALDPLRLAGGPLIESITNPDGPPGIETQTHVDAVAPQLCRMIAAHDQAHEGASEAGAAFVIACFSDPGLFAAREITRYPVFGIAESGILSALSLGARFGIIAILAGSIPRHLRYVAAMGVAGRMAGDMAIDLGVTELGDEARCFARMAEVGAQLRDEKGADVLVMGCAGMARYRERLEDHLAIAVVDPVQAAVAMALSAIRLGQTNSTQTGSNRPPA